MVPRTFVVPYVHTVDSGTTCTFEDRIIIGHDVAHRIVNLMPSVVVVNL